MNIEDFPRNEILVLFNNNVLTKENRGRGVYHYISVKENDIILYQLLQNTIAEYDTNNKLLRKDYISNEDATPL